LLSPKNHQSHLACFFYPASVWPNAAHHVLVNLSCSFPTKLVKNNLFMDIPP
jgi:hypothetical protein